MDWATSHPGLGAYSIKRRVHRQLAAPHQDYQVRHWRLDCAAASSREYRHPGGIFGSPVSRADYVRLRAGWRTHRLGIVRFARWQDTRTDDCRRDRYDPEIMDNW